MPGNSNVAKKHPQLQCTTPAGGAGDPTGKPNSPTRPELTEAAIRERAYSLWESAGRPEGDGMQFWLAAERELNTA